MHIDPALQAMIDQTVHSKGLAASSQTYLGDDSTASNPTVESKGSQLPVCNFEPPFPTLERDVNMETSG